MGYGGMLSFCDLLIIFILLNILDTRVECVFLHTSYIIIELACSG